MKLRSKLMLAFFPSLLAATPAFSQVAVGNGFTYQGRLEEAGIPASGAYDFEFRLFDAAVGGNQIGGTLTGNDLAVADGLFTTQLDFGATPFAGSARWLQISVRAGASGGAYTTLNPRQPLTVTPYALYSLDGGNWTRSGSAIRNSNTGFVGINRTAQVSGAEYFGIQAPATTTNYGGMYIRTESDQAKPFYGYKAGTSGNTAWTYLDGVTGDLRLYNGGDRLTVNSTGTVEVGTSTSGGRLIIHPDSSGQGVSCQVPASSTMMPFYGATYGTSRAAAFESHQSNSTATVHVFKNNGPALLVTGSLGGGTADPTAAQTILGGDDSEPASGGFLVLGSVASSNISIDNNEIMARNNGAVSTLFLNNDGGTVDISGADLTRVKVLEITGADMAEKFPVTDAAPLTPGMVVMIDAKNPGKLCLASGAYNRKVAGVVSGAGGLPVGTILGNLPESQDAPPIALNGRVWVNCDASTQAVEVGDLLTTSDTPGHAMSATDATRSHGAVIGKAMTALKQGEKGLVLVLVNLQ